MGEFKHKTSQCPSCKERYPVFFFPKRDLYYRCKHCLKNGMGTPSQQHMLAKCRMLISSKNNASGKGLLHTITHDDIPTPDTCKYLGVKLDYAFRKRMGQKRSPALATIDRIDPTIGYVPGNVQVISDLANRMKQNATIDQLVTFARNIIELYDQ